MTPAGQDDPRVVTRRDLLSCVAVVLPALMLRLVHLWWFADASPFFDPQPWNTPQNPLDTGEYDRWGQQIVGGDGWWTDHGQGVYFQSPVYPYFVAAHYLIFGRSLLAVAITQALMGAITCGLTAWLARRLVSPAAGWLAGGLTAVLAPALFYGPFLLKETLATFLLALALSLTVAWRLLPEGGTAGRRLLPFTGWAWGAALATWPLLAPLALAVFAWMSALRAWPAGQAAGPGKTGGGMGAASRTLAALTLGAVLAVAPCTLRNMVGEGRFVLLSDAGPRNWQVGNAANATGTYIDFPRQPLQPSTALITPLFWRHYGTKLMLMTAARDIPQVTDRDLQGPASPVLRLPLPAFGFLLPFAAAGLWLVLADARRRHWRSPWWPLLLVSLGYPLLMAVFFVVGRFRLPWVPVLAVLAALAATSLHGLATWRRRQGRVSRAAVFAVGILILGTVLVNRPRPLPRGAYPFHQTWARYHLGMGDAMARAGRHGEARRLWQEVLRVPSPQARRQAERRLQSPEAQDGGAWGR